MEHARERIVLPGEQLVVLVAGVCCWLVSTGAGADHGAVILLAAAWCAQDY